MKINQSFLICGRIRIVRRLQQLVKHRQARAAYEFCRLNDLLKYLLESKKVSAVFSLRKVNKKGSVDYGLISDVNKLDDLDRAVKLTHQKFAYNSSSLFRR